MASEITASAQPETDDAQACGKQQAANKQNPSGLSQAVYYGIGILMMKGISLLMMPYVTRQLDPAAYGLLETLLILADIGTIVIGFGLVEALYRYVNGERPNDASVVAGCLSLAFAITLMAIALLALFDDGLLRLLPAGIEVYQIWLIAIPTFLEGFIAIPLTLMRMQSLAKQFCLVNVAKAIIQAGLVIVLLELGGGIDAILIAGAIASTLMIIALLRFQFSFFDQAGFFDCLKHCDLRRIGRYGAPIVLSRIGLFAITGLDRWLLADKVGVEQLAIYAIAAKFALVLGLLMQPFGLWWFPQRIRLSQQPGGDKQCADYALLGANMGIFLGAAMMMTLPAFLILALPVDYHGAATLVIGLAVVGAIKNAGDLLNLGCFSGDSSQSQMWIQWCAAILAVAGYLWLIPQQGVWGAVMVLAVVYAVRLLLFYWYSQRRLYLPYQHKSWIITLIASAFSAGSLWLLAPLLSVAGQLVSGLLTSLVLLAVLFWFGVFPQSLISSLAGRFSK
ncbi:oligosaccharide flippase family protein [Bacterioplanoides sp.]|uniref:oligosaccharide flippase family protein n=1 Tax=Bacterioplanoides sp. TaxID=2066072 RepID=UPI003B5BCA14